ncbi:MAG: hypothetical protein ACYS8I_16535 [Planctomycetota bacterium]
MHLPDEKHDYGPSKRAGAYRFFARHLRLSLDKVAKPDGSIDESDITIETIDESDITIERPETMHVFTDDHPRPAHAVRCGEALEALLTLK